MTDETNSANTTRPVATDTQEKINAKGADLAAQRLIFKVCAVVAIVMLCVLLSVPHVANKPQADIDLSVSGELSFVSQQPRLPVLEADDWVEYTDPVAGFQLRVPRSWTRHVLGSDGDGESEDTGYAVTYLSPTLVDGDEFADYIMVELLPQPETGFLSNSSATHTAVEIDGRQAISKRIILDDYPFDDQTIDLLVHQVTLSGIDYSLGVYVVGELREEQRLDSLFKSVLQSFSFSATDWLISSIE